MSSKNPEKSLQRSQFESQLFWHEHGEGNAPQAAQASDEDEEDAFFLFWIRRPQSSCAPKNCVVVFIQNFGIRARKYQSSDTLLSFTAPVFYRCKLNIGSISRCTFQIFHGNVKIVLNERIISVELLSTTMRTIDFEAMFGNYFQFWI